MRFESLSWIYAMWLLPVLGLLVAWGMRARRRALDRLASPGLLARLAPGLSLARLGLRDCLLLGAVVCGIVSLMRPQLGFRWEETRRKGVDIVVAVDVSDSMLAEDVSPNRLQRAKRKIADLLRILEGDRVGLVAFSGVAFLQSPLTLDYGTIEMFLDYLDTDLIPVKGTSLGSAIEVALEAFRVAESEAKAILLVTDGEDLAGKAIPMAEEARKQGVRIYSIGIGSEKGAPVPNRSGGDFRKNAQGEMVFSKLDAGSLGRLAETTGGHFVRSVSSDDDLIRIYRDEIRKDIGAREQAGTRVKKYEERFQWPLALALVLLLVEFFMSPRRRTVKGVGSKLVTLFFLSACLPWGVLKATPAEGAGFSLFSSRHQGERAYAGGDFAEAIRRLEDAVVENPDDVEAKANLGSAYYKAGDFKKAQEAWSSVLRDAGKIKDESRRRPLQAKASYDLGNAAYRQGDLAAAAESYRKTLGLNPADEDAAHNLKVVERELQKRKEQQEKQDQKKNEEKNKPEEKKEPQNSEAQANGDRKNAEGAPPGGTPTPAPQGASPTPGGGQGGKMSREEAERLLNALSEDQKRALQQRIQREVGERGAEVGGNDW